MTGLSRHSARPGSKYSGKEVATYLKHPDGRATVVPGHKGESIGRGLVRKIMKDADLDQDEFLKLL